MEIKKFTQNLIQAHICLPEHAEYAKELLYIIIIQSY